MTDPTPVTTSSTSETAQLPSPRIVRNGLTQITCHAIDENGDYIAADTGTGTLEVITQSGTEWETVYEDDGTTARQFDFTGDSQTFEIESRFEQVRVVPSSLTGTGVVGLRLALSGPK